MRKMISMGLFGMVAGAAMFVGGCQTGGGEPYGLTGREEMSSWTKLKYTDQKGHYRPEYASRGEQIRPLPAEPD